MTTRDVAQGTTSSTTPNVTVMCATHQHEHQQPSASQGREREGVEFIEFIPCSEGMGYVHVAHSEG